MPADQPKQGFFAKLWNNYNHSFLFSLSLTYFNTGMSSKVDMGILYMFLNTYKLEPEKANMYMAYIGLPWTPKIVYGIVTHCFPICGSGKRSYVIIMGLL